MPENDEPWLPPVEEAEYTDEIRELLAAGTPDGRPRTAPFLRTLVRNPKLYKRWVPWATFLMTRGLLPPRARELVILRNAWRAQAEIEWAAHVEIAENGAILTSAEIGAVIIGAGHESWSPADAVVLRGVDELLSDGRLSDDTGRELARHLDAAQIVELFMLLGNYAMLAWIQRSLDLPARDGLDGLDAR